MRAHGLAAILLGLLVLAPASGSARVEPNGRCTGGKLRATGKKAFAKLACHATAAREGLAVDAVCLGKAEGKFVEAFGKAESKPPCFAIGDAASIEAKVDALVDDLVMDLRPTPGIDRCAARKLRSAGLKAQAKLFCHSRAARLGESVDSLCLDRAEERFASAFARSEATLACATTGDAAAIEGEIDAFVADVGTTLRPRLPSKCSTAKVKAAGEAAERTMKCYEDVAQKGLPVDPDCLSDVDVDLSDDFTHAETDLDCFTLGDLPLIAVLVDAFGADASTALLPSTTESECAEQKLEAAGSKADWKLAHCHSPAVRHGLPVSGVCLAVAEEGFASRFGKAEFEGDCLTTGDAAAVEAMVDTYVDVFIGVLVGSPSGAFLDGAAATLF